MIDNNQRYSGLEKNGNNVSHVNNSSPSMVSINGAVRSIFSRIGTCFTAIANTFAQKTEKFGPSKLKQRAIFQKLDKSPIAYQCLTKLGLKEKDASLEKSFDNKRMEEKIDKMTKRLSTSHQEYNHDMGNIPDSTTFFGDHVSVSLSLLRDVLNDHRLSPEKNQINLLCKLDNEVMGEMSGIKDTAVQQEWKEVKEKLSATVRALSTLSEIKDNLVSCSDRFTIGTPWSELEGVVTEWSLQLDDCPETSNQSLQKELKVAKEATQNILSDLKTLNAAKAFINRPTTDSLSEYESYAKELGRKLDDSPKINEGRLGNEWAAAKKATKNILRDLEILNAAKEFIDKPIIGSLSESESYAKEWGVMLKDSPKIDYGNPEPSEIEKELGIKPKVPAKADNEGLKEDWAVAREAIQNVLSDLKTLITAEGTVDAFIKSSYNTDTKRNELKGSNKEEFLEHCETMSRPPENTSVAVQKKWGEIAEKLIDSMVTNRVSELVSSGKNLNFKESIELVGLHSIMGTISDKNFSEEKRLEWNALKEKVETLAQQGRSI